MYASKIIIKYDPEKIRYERTVELPDGYLTINDISKHLKEGEKFGFREVETSHIGTTLFMDIVGYRIETEAELTTRITKQEEYNKNYEAHHQKYGR
jgi:predicted component of type VI protein secretion system